jgi:glycolate oxidase iron-sulfur subunit
MKEDMQLNNLEIPNDSDYLSCIRCGLCLAVCPTYREHLRETSSPRGRVALARKGMEGDLVLSRNLAKQMYACFDCLACNDICPVGIHPADLAIKMRQVQEQQKPNHWKKLILEGIIPKPERMERVTWPLRLYQYLGIRRLAYALGAIKLFPKKVQDLESMLPHLPQRPLRQILPEITRSKGKTRYRVGFFLGCAQSLMYAEESSASLRVLSRNGCEIFTPKDSVCCGMPAKEYGRIDQLKKQAQHNIKLFEEKNVETIITDCATCGSTLKDYGELFSEDLIWADRAKAFSKKVRDISEFLMSIPLEKPEGQIEGRVTYHDPCHLRRGQNVWKEPRALLQMIPGLEFIELPEADWCCGSAGSQLITHYDTSTMVLKKKTDNIANTKANYIASGCPGCQMQLNVGVQKENLQVQVVHPISLLDQSYEIQR